MLLLRSWLKAGRAVQQRLKQRAGITPRGRRSPSSGFAPRLIVGQRCSDSWLLALRVPRGQAHARRRRVPPDSGSPRAKRLDDEARAARTS
jgi:hypothetical protein